MANVQAARGGTVAAPLGGPSSSTSARDVYAALRIVNLVVRRPATAQEVADALSLEEVTALEATVAMPSRCERVRHLLHALVEAGDILYRKGTKGAYGYLHPEAAHRLHLTVGPPPHMSRRQRTKRLVTEAAHSFGRAVRFCDVMTYQAANEDVQDADRAEIARDITSLCRGGEAVIAREVVGGGEDGRYFYLPVDTRTGQPFPLPVPDEPITWLEHVWAAFQRCWTAEKDRASAERRRPRPLATGVLRARLLEETTLPQARDVKLVPNALLQLASARPPRVRVAVRRQGSHFSLWAPADVPNEQLEIESAFASDAARIIEAARRAVERTGWPAVGRRTIEGELAHDPALRPIGASTVAALLADASKDLIDDGQRGRRPRVAPRLQQVGSVAGEAYYTVTSSPSGANQEEMPRSGSSPTVTSSLVLARRFVEWRELQRRWHERDVLTQLQATDESLGPLAHLGRLRVIASGIDHSRARSREVLSLLAASVLETVLQGEAVEAEGEHALAVCRSAVQHALTRARATKGWDEEMAVVDVCGLLDVAGVAEIIGPRQTEAASRSITTDALLEIVLARGYARAARTASPTELVPLLCNRVVRISNPAYHGWRRTAPEYQFERTSAMLFSATEWGGGSAVLYAQFARQELGQLRDERFVRPGLRHPRYDVRLASAAALAFLGGDQESDAMLVQRVLEDPDVGVRKAALWACGARAGSDLMALLKQVTCEETHPDVLSLARAALDDPETVWWNA